MRKLFRRLFRTHREASSIGIIGGADGPTTIFVGAPHTEGQWRRTLETCRLIAVPRETRLTGDELAQHLTDEYGAYEVPVSQGKRQALKMNVLLNHHREVLARPPMPRGTRAVRHGGNGRNSRTWTLTRPERFRMSNMASDISFSPCRAQKRRSGFTRRRRGNRLS